MVTFVVTTEFFSGAKKKRFNNEKVACLRSTFLYGCASWAWSGKVVGVSDGDTITVLRDGHEQYKIGLYGIDAPESGQPFGKASKANLSRLVFGQTVEVDPTDIDKYGRTVARISGGGTNANSEQTAAVMLGFTVNTVTVQCVLIGRDLRRRPRSVEVVFGPTHHQSLPRNGDTAVRQRQKIAKCSLLLAQGLTMATPIAVFFIDMGACTTTVKTV